MNGTDNADALNQGGQSTEEVTENRQPSSPTARDAQPVKLNRLDALKKKQEQLKAQIAALEAQEKEAERKRDTRRKIIVGGAVLAHAALHPSFGAELRAVLKTAVLRDSDRETIQDLLG